MTLLSRRQIHVLWRMTVLFLLTLLFPPYALNGFHGYSVGYAPFFLPPRLPIGPYEGLPPTLASVDVGVELCQWLAIAVVTAVALVTLADRREPVKGRAALEAGGIGADEEPDAKPSGPKSIGVA